MAMSRLFAGVFVSVTLLAVAPPVLAQEGGGGKPEWRLTLGAGAMMAPSYLGSDDYDVSAVPLIDLRYADRVFLSTRDGLGANLLRDGNFSAGPVLKYRFGRDQDDDDALRGLGDIDPAGEAGAFVKYSVAKLSMGAELRQGFGGHEAVIGELWLNRRFNLSERLDFNIGPKLTLASSDFTETYFGIDAGQAARSGYRRYDADGVFISYGLNAALGYKLTRQVRLGAFAGVEQIGGDAADSPIVDQAGSATQARLGLTISYSFGW
ncbi:MipA/OmpV family protein [Ferrovibrio sp.]|jgi:outer membrane protein|uniref:MipA/OmpV family protein n=1 Tax=Ferrovibrio sp. TaxID=1917215 RepID=UPI0035AECAB9